MKLTALFGSAIAALSLLALPSTAHAQNIGDLTLRLEPGIAVPTSSPQTSRFTPGFDGAAKLGISIIPELDLGITASELVLPSQISGVGAGTATMFGGYARVKRSHSNGSTGFAAVSPWIDGDMDGVITGPLTRFGWSVGIGAEWPTSKERWLWIGPFARYQGIFQPGGNPGFDYTDDKTVIVGLSFEFGGKSKPAPEPVVIERVVVKETPCPPEPTPIVVAPKPAPIQQEFVVRFPFNSDTLKSSQQNILDQATASFNALCTNRQPPCKVVIDGYASSEGQLKYNQTLSQKRADAAAAYLTGKGVSKATITSTGKGIDNPVGNNATAAGRSANRRAEVVIKIVQGAK